MAEFIILPKQGQSVETCIITEIHKKKGDAVKKGDVLFAYETDKAAFEAESPTDGVVLEVFYNEGDDVPVLKNIMLIGQAGEDYSALLAEQPATQSTKKSENKIEAEKTAEKQPTSGVAEKTLLKTENSEQFISPRARNLAQKEALNVSAIAGSGANGRITEKDIFKELENRPKMTPLAKKIADDKGLQPVKIGSGLAGTAKSTDLTANADRIFAADYEDKKLSNIRKIIAKSMHESLQNSAQLTHHLGADARNILALRKQAKKDFDEGKTVTNLTINDFVCFAVVKALKKFPNVNSHFLGETMRLFNKVHLAVAVDTDRGLMVPVVRNADDLSIQGLASRLKNVAELCRKGGIDPDLLSAEAATFTVSNLGNYGVEMFTPVINLPQAAILGVNAIVPRPKDFGDGVYGFAPYIGLSLTYDHRAIDGGEATRFLKQIATEIETMTI